MLISKFNCEKIEELVSKFEKEYKVTIPLQYRNFLLKYNGGKTPKSEFKINRVNSDIRGFYGFGDAEYNYNSLEEIKFNEWITDDMLAIGKNGFGDYIMLGIGKENNGKIYFHYHDRPKKFIELTSDLISFVDKCKSKKIGHVRTIEERKQGMVENGLGDRITLESLKGWQEEIDIYGNMVQEKLILDCMEE